MNPVGTTVAGVNLLSSARKARTQRRILTKRWGGGLAVYALALCGATFVVMLSSRVGASIDNELSSASSQLSRAENELKQLQSQQFELRKRVTAARSVGYHADWSILLRMVAGLRGETIHFDDISLTHHVELIAREKSGASEKKLPPVRQERYELALIGVAKDVRGVNEFVVGLEETGLFERVRRGESSPPDDRGTHFRLICEMRDQPAGSEEKKP